MVNEIEKIHIDGFPVLIQINEGAYLGEGYSCLSIVYMGGNGFFVDDNAYFGEGKNHTNEKWGFEVPLDFETGLAYFDIEIPTSKDLET